jgi:hypothetical protein
METDPRNISVGIALRDSSCGKYAIWKVLEEYGERCDDLFGG